MFGWLLGREEREEEEPTVTFQDFVSDAPKSQSATREPAPLKSFATAGYSFSALQTGP